MKTFKIFSTLASLFLLLNVTTVNAQQKDDQPTNLGTFQMGEQNLDIEKKSPVFKAAGATDFRAKKDQTTGKTYGPNDKITMPDGTSVPASAYFAEIEKLERDFNAKGYSIESDPANNTVGKVKVNEADLAKQRASQPASGKFISETDIKGTFKAANTVGGKELKSLADMTEAEFNEAKSSRTHIGSGQSTGDLQGTAFQVSSTPMAGISAAAPGALVKSINQSTGKSWVYGSPSSFQASISGNVSISGKIYQPAGNLSQMTYAQATAELAKTNSEFNFASSGRVDGTLFNKAFNVLSITGNSRVPANSAQAINIGVSVSVVGLNVYNYNQNFAQSFNATASKSFYKEIRFSYSTVIVVVPVTGSVGIRGTIGVNYGISGNKLSLTAGVTPFAELGGFAEAYINLLVVKAGVTGSITFVKGSIPLQAQLYISINNGIIIGERLYAGYQLNFLAGTIQLFAKVWTFWSGWKSYYYTLWSTSGYSLSGAFFNYQYSQFIPW